MGISLEELSPTGWLYGPDARGAGPRPGLVLLHGAEGPEAGWAHRFAVILAAHGFFALPLSYGEGDVFGVRAIRDVDLAQVPAAGAALADHPRVAGHVGLFGWSKGGEAALLVAALGAAPFAAVAAHAAPAEVTASFEIDRFRAEGRLARTHDAPRAWCWAGHDAALAPGTPIPIEEATVPIFLSSGTADAVVPHAETRRLADRLAKTGRPADLFVAEGEGHALGPAAETMLWARLTAFFDRTLRAKTES